jgi:hypothetical protein
LGHDDLVGDLKINNFGLTDVWLSINHSQKNFHFSLQSLLKITLLGSGNLVWDLGFMERAVGYGAEGWAETVNFRGKEKKIQILLARDNYNS